MADGHSRHFAPPIGIDTNGDNNGDRDDMMVAPDFDAGGIEPGIGSNPLDGTGEKGRYLPVDLATKVGDLAFADPCHAGRFAQIIDRAGGYPRSSG